VYSLFSLHGCASEDTNNDGILAHANNYNSDTFIWPGLVVNSTALSAVTAANGYATINLIYAKDHAKWVAVRLVATATVSGTESTTQRDLWLPGLSADYSNQSQEPPGLFSPYGGAALCSLPQ
jgi:hypothetical protein